MSEPKTYHIPLRSDLEGWKMVRVQVDVLSTGSKERLVKLQEDFKVLPVGGDTAAYAVLEKTKKLINEGTAVEFYATVADGKDPWDEQPLQGATFQVEVKLDLAAMAQTLGTVVAGMMPGMGFLGGVVAQGLPQEMGLLSGVIELKAQEVVCQLTLSKFRWEPLQKKLTEFVAPGDLKKLFQAGGELRVPVKVEPQQQAQGETLQFEGEIEIWDVRGTLSWFGRDYEGQYADEAHTCLVFYVEPAAAPAAAGQGPPVVA